MAKLYLIRRNLESFTGPLTLNEMRDAYKRMAFGLQDEVCGHCGPWITFDDLAAIKKHYPEVARIVNDEMLAGWGVSGAAVRIVNEDTKRVDIRKQKGLGLAITFLVIAVVAFVAAIYMANNARLSGKFRDAREDVSIEKLQGYVDRNDLAGMHRVMEVNLDQILDKYKKAKKPDPRWLPFMRSYAFATEGSLPGINPKAIRGDNVSAAPIDCSVKTWRTQLRASVKNWNELIVDRKLVRTHWGRMLAWDPHWIRRRMDKKSWPGIGNYHVGCLLMAEKAVNELMADTSLVTVAADWERIGIMKIKDRLQWMLDITRSGVSSIPTAAVADNALSVWTCMESANDVKDLASCRILMDDANDPMSAYNEEKFGWNFARVVFSTRGNLSAELQPSVAAYGSKLPRLDYYTRIDFRNELKVLRAVSRANQPVERTIERQQLELPDIKILPN